MLEEKHWRPLQNDFDISSTIGVDDRMVTHACDIKLWRLLSVSSESGPY